MLTLRDTQGLPEADIAPPVVAEPGDPFASLRVIHLVARIPRGEPVRLRDIVDRLNAEHVDWSFSRPVVATAVLQLQANWLADYRTADGIRVADDLTGGTDRDRGQPTRRSLDRAPGVRLADTCRERLRAFAVEEGAIP